MEILTAEGQEGRAGEEGPERCPQPSSSSLLARGLSPHAPCSERALSNAHTQPPLSAPDTQWAPN